MATVSREHATGTRSAAERVYDAECALHAAHQTHVDEWIASASERLHEALVEYLARVRA